MTDKLEMLREWSGYTSRHTGKPWGTWVAQSVKLLTLGFGSGHDLPVCKFEPRIGLCTDSVEPAQDSLSLPLSLSLSLSLSACALSLSLKINFKKKRQKNSGHLGGSVGVLQLRS